MIKSVQGMLQGILSDSVGLSININETSHIGAKLKRISHEINDRTVEMSDTVSHLSVEGGRDGEGGGGNSAIERVNVVVEQTQERVLDLVKSSEEIKRILGIIAAISNQTKLLSLNATIEAARAGEAGRGFAVVAGEVKKLAEETANSAEEIRQKVEGLSNVTHEISSRMEDVQSVVKEGLKDQHKIVSDISTDISKIACLTDQSVELIDQTLGLIDSSESVVSKCLTQFSAYQLENLTVQLAKSDHVIWKKKLSNMAAGRVSINPDSLADHTNCRLGKWYYSDASLPHRSNPAFAEMEKFHKSVHEHGILAARKYQEGDTEGALKEIDEVEKSSMGVLKSLDRLIGSHS